MTELTERPSLCIFANFFIDNEERLQRMKDSFFSFRDVQPEEWRINIRGRLKQAAGDFLATQLGEQLHLHYLESKRGWFFDSYSFMKDTQSDFVFFWVEDHVCLVGPGTLMHVLNEMHNLSADQLWYSWFHNGTWRTLGHLPVADEGDYVSTYKIDEASASKARKSLGRDFYVVSAVSILKREFFLRVLCSNRPYLKRWPKHLPFDFEKTSKDRVASEIRWAMPKTELFAAIDDDHGHIGYSLISRGLYPDRVTRGEMKQMEFGKAKKLTYIRGAFHLLPAWTRMPITKALSYLRRAGFTLGYYIH